jgi:hypothetical protein
MTVRRGFFNLSWSCAYPFSANSSTGREGGESSPLVSSFQIPTLRESEEGRRLGAGLGFPSKPKLDKTQKMGRRNPVANVMRGS